MPKEPTKKAISIHVPGPVMNGLGVMMTAVGIAMNLLAKNE